MSAPASGSATPALLRRLRRAHQRVIDRVARRRSMLLDRVLPRMSEAANYSRLWLAIAVALMLTGSRDHA
jgi:hypothetical protein